ncbi:MAG: VWA domain-containing protein [Sphingomonas sp.]|jgi:Ca-activated chloride channel family protein|uniref:vWA domain-containing protein n=1 Tax=Sphingomonas sp. TaxID=28214 RepID=UPI003563FB15
MPRLYRTPLLRTIAAGLSVMLVASCARSGTDQPPATAANDARAADGAIVVTASRIDRASRPTGDVAAVTDYAAPPPPPPPPPPSPPPPPPAMIAGNAKLAAPRVAMPIAEPRPYAPPYYQDVGRDRFTATAENPFRLVREEPVSTFSIDVDTASYAFVRASLNRNTLPQPAAVRTEELVNYFPYDYVAPRSAALPFSTNVAVFPSPWTAGRKLVRIGIRGYAIQQATRPRANLVFLIDTSGSMYAPNKLPLVKQSLEMLLDQLDANDSVAIVTYAGSAGTALAPTPASQKGRIRAVIEGLGAGGSTAGAEGIRQAYALAEENLDPHGVNRVILATDGDFNVGITSQGELKGYIERERSKGVFLSVLGFGMGNYNDALMQTLAQNGNGTAAYIDTLNEARKTLVDEASSTLFPIAKDVKIQVEFNPATVAEYRLIGYETRMLNRDDFDNDKVDAGDVGSGQTVTALYEVVPVGGPRAIGDLRYGVPAARAAASRGGELGFVKIRYKLPKSDTSRLISTPIDRAAEYASFAAAPQDARFATSVAAFAELLRGGKYSGTMRYDDVLRIATAARGADEFGYRSEFIQLVRAARSAATMAALER